MSKCRNDAVSFKACVAREATSGKRDGVGIGRRL